MRTGAPRPLLIRASNFATKRNQTKNMEWFANSAQYRSGAELGHKTGRRMPSQAANKNAGGRGAADDELLRQFTRGKEAAFDALYDRYQGLLYRFAWHMSGNAATAEEVTQEAFMQLIRHPENYDRTRGSLGGYLFGIARNLSRRAVERSYVLEPM